MQADVAVGRDFVVAVREAIKKINDERQAEGLDSLCLSFFVVMSVKEKNMGSPTTRCLDTALDFWTQLQYIKKQHNRVELWEVARKDMKLKVATESRGRRNKRQKRTMRRSSKLKLLEKAVTKIIRRKERTLKASVKRRWGVPTLPDGIEVCDMDDPHGGLLCTVFQLRKGGFVRGPPRRDLQHVISELGELSRLQQAHGDHCLCEEIQQRDVEAATSLFLQQLARRRT